MTFNSRARIGWCFDVDIGWGGSWVAQYYEVTQPSHWFFVLDWLRYDEVSWTFMKAQADSINNLGMWHVVSVVDGDTFNVAKEWTFQIPNLLPAGEYVLSTSTPGAFTQIVPTVWYELYGMEVLDNNTINFYTVSAQYKWEIPNENLVFDVKVLDDTDPFRIPVFSPAWQGRWITAYDFLISVDGWPDVNYAWAIDYVWLTSWYIYVPLSIGEHTVEIKPNWQHVVWRACGVWAQAWTMVSWNNDPTKLTFWLRHIPARAFMLTDTDYWIGFLSYLFAPYSDTEPATALTSAPTITYEPWITTIWDDFMQSMFMYCRHLTHIPEWFNLPQDVTNVGNNFCASTLDSCPNLTTLPESFNIPQWIITIWGSFMQNMFSYSWFTHLPAAFNIPQGITTVWTQFLSSTFEWCTSLAYMPSWFSIPPNIDTIWDYFMAYAWSGCTSLTSNSPTISLDFPNVAWTSYAEECFLNCPITPNTPAPWETVLIATS